MMASPALVIVNPVSGTRSKQGLEEAVYRLMGAKTEVIYTEYAGHAALLAAQAANAGIKQVVAAGGDGTVNEIARSLTGTETALGIIPQGSGNGLARHLRIPMNRDRAIEVIAASNIKMCDTATAGDMPFFCTMGTGFDAKISQAFENAPRRGLLTYTKIAMEQFPHYRPQPYMIVADNETVTVNAFLVAVCNASQYGNNAYIAPRASTEDGLLDVTIITEGDYSSLALTGLRLFTKGIERSPLIRSMRGRRITIHRSSPGPVHIDGDAVMMPATVAAECLSGSLKVIVP